MNSTSGSRFVDKRTLSRDELIVHIRDRLLAARDDIVGIILFGSFTRGEAWHDIDVLIVLRERIPTRKAWAAIMRECQDAIGLYNLDLIPTHLDGLRQGLAEHVFILMDMAFDGLVIYGGETIERLLREARKEITARGIRRTDTGGWRFPVNYRQSTPLSLGTNRERAQRWLEDAGRESEVAEQLEQSGYFDRCVYHCQQAIERAVKAVLICFGAFERVHWVGGILEQELSRQNVGSWKEHLLKLARLSKDIEHAALDARYIIEGEASEDVWIPSEHYFRPEATAALDAARQALQIAHDFIAWWFAPDEGD
jgi:HEPN domain-containing protein/predicted nucleotidyltransferase